MLILRKDVLVEHYSLKNNKKILECYIKVLENIKYEYLFLYDLVYILMLYISDTMNISMYETAGTKCMALSNTRDKLAIGLDGNSKPLLLDVNK